MTVRKPVNQARSQPAAQSVPNHITPISLNTETAESTELASGGILENGKDTNNPWQSSGANPWDGSHVEMNENELPPVPISDIDRHFGGRSRKEGLPHVLQAGPMEETPRSSWESQRPTEWTNNAPGTSSLPPIRAAPAPPQPITSTNPYHRPHTGVEKAVGEASLGSENIADIWGNGPLASPPLHEPARLRHPFAEPWAKFDTPPAEQGSPGLGAVTIDSSNPWSVDPPANVNTNNIDGQAAEALTSNTRSLQDHHIPSQPFENIGHDATDFSSVSLQERPHLGGPVSDGQLGLPQTSEPPPPRSSLEGDVGPPLPPRLSQEKQDEPSPLPPRPPKAHETVTDEAIDAQVQWEESAKPRRVGETYQIRHVNWFDASSPTNPRRSPIMVQNANGPCPLLALVNALVLSTPADYATALVETLRLREQVSLGLLLDAVIDELIGRNGDLPDVSDMYAFLLALHTGMNANPQFVPSESPLNLMDAPIEGVLSSEAYESRKPGGFEETSEMKLYSTFAIPLVHGWVPPRNHPAFAALKRTARTYEDAQNLMFREEELEEKLQQQGLSSEEQITLEDIASVKYYLSSTATQLTGYGLDCITATMAPGSVAILFRNNHFSTLYKHPKSGQLLTLVTDMGYAGHDEVVWESLVDVNGEGCEFFSGDFRPVGNNAGDTQQQPHAQGEEGWTTVNSRSRRGPASNQQSSHSDPPALSALNINSDANPSSPNTEQEDHDLALAMQLQEEEDERDRQEAPARDREVELSQAYLNNSDASGRRTFPGFSTGATGAQGGPNPPPRGRGSGRGRGAPSSRPTPPRKPVDTDDAPPPTYEQAAKGPAYHPPTHPPYASPSPGGSTSRPQARPKPSSAYGEHAASYGAGSPSPYASSRRGHGPRGSSSGAAFRGGGVEGGMARRKTGGLVADGDGDEERKEKEKDRDCIIM